jgi:hypothetical protein
LNRIAHDFAWIGGKASAEIVAEFAPAKLDAPERIPGEGNFAFAICNRTRTVSRSRCVQRP